MGLQGAGSGVLDCEMLRLGYRISWICNCTAHDGAVLLCRMGSPIIGMITTASTVYKAPKKAIPEPLIRQKLCTGPAADLFAAGDYRFKFSMNLRQLLQLEARHRRGI